MVLSYKKGGVFMKKAGIILIVLQVVALFGGFVGGSISMPSDFYGVGEFLGFCLPGIIGIVLLIKSKKKEKQQS